MLKRRSVLALLLTPATVAWIAACGDGGGAADPTGAVPDAGSLGADASTPETKDDGSGKDGAADSGSDAADAAVAYSVGGQVQGLLAPDAGVDAGPGAAKLVLENNGKDALTVATNGPFAFATKLATGASYDVTVKTPPAGHTCTATNATGKIASADVTNVQITCAPATYEVSVDVTGLKGTGLVLQNNGADDLSITAAGTKAFASKVAYGSPYAVTIATSPSYPTQKCTLTSDTGVVLGPVTVGVACADDVLASTDYASDKSFDVAGGEIVTTIVSLAWDGTNYWVASGGGPSGDRLAYYDAAGAFVGKYQPNIDFRSVFTTDGSGAKVYARGYSSNLIQVKDAAGAFTTQVTLAGTVDSQVWVVSNTGATEYLGLWNGVVHRWSAADGSALPDVTLVGYGSGAGENDQYYSRHIVAASGYWLTVANGVVSAWDPATGARMKSATLTGAPTGFDATVSFSYANGRVWLYSGGVPGKWMGWNIGL